MEEEETLEKERKNDNYLDLYPFKEKEQKNYKGKNNTWICIKQKDGKKRSKWQYKSKRNKLFHVVEKEKKTRKF